MKWNKNETLEFENIAYFDINIFNFGDNLKKINETINHIWEEFILTEERYDLKKYLRKWNSDQNVGNAHIAALSFYFSVVSDIHDYENKGSAQEIADLVKNNVRRIILKLKEDYSEIISGKILSFDNE